MTAPCPGVRSSWAGVAPRGRCGPRAHGAFSPRWTPSPSTRPASTTPAPATQAGTVSASAPPWPPTLRRALRRGPACSGGRQTCAVSVCLSWGRGAALAVLPPRSDGHMGSPFCLPGPRAQVLLLGGCAGLASALPESGHLRSPSAAIFCDYYNPPDECEWHYEPCGNRSFETCRTINGIHSNISVSYLEGERASGVEGRRPREGCPVELVP